MITRVARSLCSSCRIRFDHTSKFIKRSCIACPKPPARWSGFAALQRGSTSNATPLSQDDTSHYSEQQLQSLYNSIETLEALHDRFGLDNASYQALIDHIQTAAELITGSHLQLGLVLDTEWEIIIRSTLDAGDLDYALKGLDILKDHHANQVENLDLRLLNHPYPMHNVNVFSQLSDKLQKGKSIVHQSAWPNRNAFGYPITPERLSYLIASHLHSHASEQPRMTTIKSTQDLIHKLEAQGTPPSQEGYATIMHAYLDASRDSNLLSDPNGSWYLANQSLCCYCSRSRSFYTYAIHRAPKSLVGNLQHSYCSVRTWAPADILLSRILSQRTASPDRLFSHVPISARIMNAYLGIYYSHAPLERALAKFEECYSHVEPNAYTFVNLLERLARAAEPDRQPSLAFAKKTWINWQVWIQRVDDGQTDPVLAEATPRAIERAWAAIIRIHSLCDDVEAALALLREFVTKHPPACLDTQNPASLSTQRSRLEYPTPPSSDKSLATLLATPAPRAGLLVRFTTPEQITEPGIGPHLLFSDLTLLHQRLVSRHSHRKADIAFVTWACKSYELQLKRRRDRALGVVKPARSKHPEKGHPEGPSHP
ncbi:hypothetical protein RSAG8_05395, partial [Rhizoctonia solani AG-8 WAC10335]